MSPAIDSAAASADPPATLTAVENPAEAIAGPAPGPVGEPPPASPPAADETASRADAVVPMAEEAVSPESSARAPADAKPAVIAPGPADLSPAACAARLNALFPALFGTVAPGSPPRPIKLRIQADIQQRAPGVFTRKALSAFLHRYTTSTPYLRALIAAASRFDLDGQPAGEIAEEHREAARQEVQRRRALVAARRAAEGPARSPNIEPSAPRVSGQGAGPGGGPNSPHRSGRPDRQDSADGASRPHRPNGSNRPKRPDLPSARPERPPRPRPSARPAPAGPGPTQARAEVLAPAPLASAVTATPDDPARRERALLLRAWESSPLTKANFCALKRLSEAAFDALLEQARNERSAGATKTRS